MYHLIKDAVAVPLRWNDDESVWELAPEATSVGSLLHAGDNAERGECPCENEVEHDAAWGRAVAADLPTSEDLAHMLGAALVATVREHNKYVEHRSASPNLIGMLKDRIVAVTGLQLTPLQVSEIVQKLLPVISSVDQNAHLRGRAEALAEQQLDGGAP